MSTFHDRTNELSGNPLDGQVPARWLMGPVVVNRDLSIGVGWEVDFPYLSTLGESFLGGFHGNLRSLLNTLPQNIDLQVIFDQDHDGSAIVAAMGEKMPDHKIARTIIEERIAGITEGFKRSELRRLRAYVIIVRKNPLPSSVFADRASKEFAKGDGSRKPGPLAKIWQKVLAAVDNAEKLYQFELGEWEEAVADLSQAADFVQGELTQLKLNPRLLDENGAAELLYRVWNPAAYDRGGRPRPYVAEGHTPITDHILFDPVRWSTNGTIEADGYMHRIMTVRTPASPLRFTQWDDLVMHSGLHRMRLVVTIQHDSVEKRIKFLKTHRLPQLRSAAAKDPTKNNQLQEVLAELEELGQDREKVWRATQVIHVWGKDEEELESACNTIRAYGEKTGGMVISKETDGAWAYWIFSQPFWTRDFDRYRDNIFNSSQLATQIPAIGIHTGIAKRMGAVFETTAGTPFNLFFHDDNFTNANAIIVGGSGTGKTFLLNSIISQLGRYDPISIIIDLGGSYRAMCEIQGGHYIDMDLTTKSNCMNPLALPPGVEADSDHVEAMVTFVEKLCMDPARDVTGHLPVEMKSLIEKALGQLILRSEGKEFFLNDLRNLLTEGYQAQGGKELATRLQQWCRGVGGMPTRYGNLFDGETMIDLSNPFMVFDLSRVKDNKELSAIMFSTILRHVTLLGERYPGRVKLLAFDEAWSFMEDPAIARFIITGFRALRKVGYSTVAISQGVSEFMQTANKSAILNNLAHRIILRQNNQGEVDLLATEFGLSPEEAAIAGGLKSVSGHYSQALVSQITITGERRSLVVMNRPGAVGYWASTTNPKDREAILECRTKRGMKYGDAISYLAKQYPHGVMNA